MLSNKVDKSRLLPESLYPYSSRMFFTGRGATAIILLYGHFGIPGETRVILPSIGCPSLLATALHANLNPVIVDVDSNLNIDPDLVAAVVRESDIVLAVDLFGVPCRMTELEEICRKKGAVLIEDACQAYGAAHPDGRIAGTCGDAGVLSFASGKILDSSGGGAIVSTSKGLIDELSEKVEKLPERDPGISTHASVLRDRLTEMFNAARHDSPEIASGWFDAYKDAGDIYRYSATTQEIAELSDAVDRFDETAAERIKGVEIYRSTFHGINAEVISYPDGSVPFRFTMIFPGMSGTEVQEMTGEIRAAGIHASNLYLPLQWLAPDRLINTGCPYAESTGTRVLNLWVTGGIPERESEKLADIIKKWAGKK